jgi:hypothetical protein
MIYKFEGWFIKINFKNSLINTRDNLEFHDTLFFISKDDLEFPRMIYKNKLLKFPDKYKG